MDPAEFLIEDVKALLSVHAPDWAHKSIQPVSSSGTDNALFRLDSDHVLRIPTRPSAVASLTKELDWLPKFATLPLDVPNVAFHGHTESELGFDFGILTWLEGSIATSDSISDHALAAETLADFLYRLRAKSTDNAPQAGPMNSNRGARLAQLTERTLASIEVLADEVHTDAARCLWEKACSTPFDGQPVWLHGDLKADNMLAQAGKLTGVIDWGLSAAGDPAVDIAAAWTWVAPGARDVFQLACGADEATWERAQGWALYCAVIALSFYRGRSHETLCEQSRHTLEMLGLRRS